MDLNHGSTGYEPVGISGRPAAPAVFLTTLPRCGATQEDTLFRPSAEEKARRVPVRSRSRNEVLALTSEEVVPLGMDPHLDLREVHRC